MPIKGAIDMHALGKRLKLARDLTIQQFSTLSGMGINQISRLENGDKPGVRVDTLAALAGPLGVSLDHLAGLGAPTAAPSAATPREDAHEETPPNASGLARPLVGPRSLPDAVCGGMVARCSRAVSLVRQAGVYDATLTYCSAILP
jgi:transcriptional regulator with XRE-family HTH domain